MDGAKPWIQCFKQKYYVELLVSGAQDKELECMRVRIERATKNQSYGKGKRQKSGL